MLPDILDSTMIGTFRSCPQKFMMGHILNLSSKKLSVHLHFGACLAAGLEAYRKTFYPAHLSLETTEELTQLKDEALYQGILAIMREWGDYPQEDEPPKTLANCLAGLEFYFNSAHPPATDLLQPYYKEDGTPAVEFTFTLPLHLENPFTGNPFIYAGRFDMLGVYNGMTVVCDEKTTTQLGARWSAQWDLRSQFAGYAFAASQHGYKVQGTLIRGLAFGASWIRDADAFVPMQQWMLDRWWLQLHQDVKRIIRCAEEGYWDYNLDHACTEYSGCSYKQLCLVPMDKREPWIEAQYIERHWNPLSNDPLREARLSEQPLFQVISDGNAPVDSD